MVEAFKVKLRFSVASAILLLAVVSICCALITRGNTGISDWKSLSEIDSMIESGGKPRVLVCCFADWDTFTYRHYDWLKKSGRSLIARERLTACRVDVGELKGSSLRIFQKLFPNVPTGRPGVAIVDFSSDEVLWYDQFENIQSIDIAGATKGVR